MHDLWALSAKNDFFFKDNCVRFLIGFFQPALKTIKEKHKVILTQTKPRPKWIPP